MCGPFFEYSDYIMYIERKGRYANIPWTVVAAFKNFFIGKGKPSFIAFIY